MGFGCYGVKSGHTESFIAGDRERPTTDAQMKKLPEGGFGISWRPKAESNHPHKDIEFRAK